MRNCLRVWVALFLVTVTLPGALGFQVFTTTIPNGARVPSPCQEGALWQGVGHLNFHGAGATNVFGADFSEHGNVSVYVVCGVWWWWWWGSRHFERDEW